MWLLFWGIVCLDHGWVESVSYTHLDVYKRQYHVYAADWRADAIIWYIDGKEIYRYTDASKITNKPMYMLVNLAIGGEWPGNPDTSTTFPQNFDIDYVRAWKPGTGANPSINPSVVPSVPYVCLGPCPTLPTGVTSPINPTQGTVQPTGGQTIPSTVPSIADPCVSTATSIAVSYTHRIVTNSCAEVIHLELC